VPVLLQFAPRHRDPKDANTPGLSELRQYIAEHADDFEQRFKDIIRASL
jgi:hypothetical protein